MERKTLIVIGIFGGLFLLVSFVFSGLLVFYLMFGYLEHNAHIIFIEDYLNEPFQYQLQPMQGIYYEQSLVEIYPIGQVSADLQNMCQMIMATYAIPCRIRPPIIDTFDSQIDSDVLFTRGFAKQSGSHQAHFIVYVTEKNIYSQTVRPRNSYSFVNYHYEYTPQRIDGVFVVSPYLFNQAIPRYPIANHQEIIVERALITQTLTSLGRAIFQNVRERDPQCISATVNSLSDVLQKTGRLCQQESEHLTQWQSQLGEPRNISSHQMQELERIKRLYYFE
ncbi:MAG: hypothetical protein ACMXYF_02435 [Candidatus Woesearchaeota archaeon]